MALGTLTLSTTAGVKGRRFSALIQRAQGATSGPVEVLNDGAPGFSVVNGKVMSQSLPYAVSTVVLREYEPGVGSGFRDTRIDITAASAPAVSEDTNGSTVVIGGGGGAPSAQSSTATVSGAVYTYQRLLGSSSTIALVAGSSSNLTLNTTSGVISATAPIGVGVSQTATVRESLAGIAVEVPITITGASANPTPSDTTAPTLTSATGTQTGQTTATVGVTTDEANGTLYFFVSTSSTPPSATALKAGTGAVTSGALSITSIGAKSQGLTGLTAATQYYTHWLHRDAAGNESAILTGPGFTTAAASSGPSTRQMAYATGVAFDGDNQKTNRGAFTRKTLVFAADAPSFVGYFDNRWCGANGEVSNVSTVTILQHAYTTADGSKSKIVTFDNGGSTTKTLAPGVFKIPHDPVTLADLGLTTFDGATIVVSTQYVVSDTEATAYALQNCSIRAGVDYSYRFPPDTAVITPPGIGAPAAQTGQVNAIGDAGFTVTAIVGTHSKNVMLMNGDSISWGTGDNTSQHMIIGMAKAGINSQGINAVPTLRISRAGTRAVEFLDSDLGQMRRAYLFAGSGGTAYENYAANDLSTSPAAGTNVTVHNNKKAVWALYRAAGVSRIVSVLPLPRTTTGSSNTPHPGWVRGGEADLLRQKVLASLAANEIDGVLTGNALRAGTDPSADSFFLWKNFAFTTDGTHMSDVGYEVVNPEIRATLVTTPGDELTYTSGTVANDTFDGTAGVSIKSRAMNTGQNWLTVTGSTGDALTNGSGLAYQSPAGYLVTDAAISTRQSAELDVTIVAAATPEQGVQLRSRRTAITNYSFVYTAATGLGRIIRYVDGGATVLASIAVADPGVSFTIRGEADGPFLRLLINGAEVATAIDGTLYRGVAGFRSSAASTSANGRQFAAFRAGNL